MNLLIYGAGSLGREILELAIHCNRQSSSWSDFIFIDDINPNRELAGHRVLSYAEAMAIPGQRSAVVAVGEPSHRAAFRRKLEDSGVTLATLVHPLAFVSEHATVEPGAIICYGCFVSTDVQIKKNALVYIRSVVSHDCVVGEDSVISINTILCGHISVGNQSYLGASAVVRQKLNIGDRTIVGMSSTVLDDIPSDVIAHGTPAKVIRTNNSEKVF